MSKAYIERGALCKACGESITKCNLCVVKEMPAADVVPKAAYDQVAWERNTAIEQLREDYGVGLGEKKSADVVEVKHGRWEWREEWETHPEMRSCDLISCGWYCTECGIELGEYLTQKTGQHIILDDDTCKPRLTNCPNCGAKMDGE